MTPDKPFVIGLAGVPLHQRLAPHVPGLARSVVDRLAAELPVYAALPSEQLRGDITRVAERSIRAFVEVLRTGRQPGPEHLALVRASAVRRAEEGVPLEAVVDAYFLGAQSCVESALADAADGDLPAVLACQHLLLRYLRLITATAAAGYFQGRWAALDEEHGARQALLAALLDERPPDEAAERAGITLPACYLVLSLAIGPHADELDESVDRGVAARRKLRLLRTELERRAGDGVLTRLSPDGGLALIPADGPADGWDPERWERVAAALAQLGRLCGAELTAGAAAAAPGAVADAARLAAEVRAVAEACDRGPGLYRLPDVLLEYQLTRPGPGRDRLAALVAPLSGRPELLGTLRAFFSCGLDRRSTAAALQVHPNTVDYRLRRASALTGLDAVGGTDLPTLHAALVAYGHREGAAADPDRRRPHYP